MFVLVPALPGLAYAGMMRLLGVHDAFFVTGSAETPLTRATATVVGMAQVPARRPAGAGGAAGRVLVPARGPAAGRPGEPAMAMDLLPGLACDHLHHVRVRRSRDPRLAVAQREPDHDLRSGPAVHGNRRLDGHRRGRPFRPCPRPRTANRHQPASTCRKYATVPASPSRTDTGPSLLAVIDQATGGRSLFAVASAVSLSRSASCCYQRLGSRAKGVDGPSTPLGWPAGRGLEAGACAVVPLTSSAPARTVGAGRRTGELVTEGVAGGTGDAEATAVAVVARSPPRDWRGALRLTGDWRAGQ